MSKGSVPGVSCSTPTGTLGSETSNVASGSRAMRASGSGRSPGRETVNSSTRQTSRPEDAQRQQQSGDAYSHAALGAERRRGVVTPVSLAWPCGERQALRRNAADGVSRGAERFFACVFGDSAALRLAAVPQVGQNPHAASMRRRQRSQCSPTKWPHEGQYSKSCEMTALHEPHTLTPCSAR